MNRFVACLPLALALALALAGCAGIPTPDTAAVDQRAAAAKAQILRLCVASQMFRPIRNVADGVIIAAKPILAIPIDLKNAGVEKVCANPDVAAHDAAGIALAMSALINRAASASQPR